MFLDYNQNAKDRTTCSAYSVRPLPDARVSAPLDLGRGRRTASRPTSPWRRCRRASRRAAIRTRAWTAPRDRSNRCSSSRRATRPPAWAMRPGRRTTRRWRARRRAWRRRAPASRAPPRKRPPRARMPLVTVANSPRQGGRAGRPRTLEAAPPRGRRPPGRRRRPGRRHARPVVDLDAHPRQPAPRSRGDTPAPGDARPRRRPDPRVARGHAQGAGSRRTRARAACPHPDPLPQAGEGGSAPVRPSTLGRGLGRGSGPAKTSQHRCRFAWPAVRRHAKEATPMTTDTATATADTRAERRAAPRGFWALRARIAARRAPRLHRAAARPGDPAARRADGARDGDGVGVRASRTSSGSSKLGPDAIATVALTESMLIIVYCVRDGAGDGRRRRRRAPHRREGSRTAPRAPPCRRSCSASGWRSSSASSARSPRPGCWRRWARRPR